MASPGPTLMTDSGSFLMATLNSLMSFRVHIDGAAIGTGESIEIWKDIYPIQLDTV